MRSSPAPAPPVVVKKSAIQGRGVFATRAIAKGERIIEYVGERISHEDATARYDDEKMRRHHTFLFAVDDETCIDATASGNESRYINHSCEPNANVKIVRGRVFITAARPIAAGDEVLYDYWYTTDDSYTLADLRRVYPCRCGVATCRGTLAAIVEEKPKRKAATRATSPKGLKKATTTKNVKKKRRGSR
jgi:SET domain-containing protein